MIGKKIQDRYQLEALLGQGGMGMVYRGTDLLLDREVAIKILTYPGESGMGTEGRARLLAEAKATARLNHPNIVNIFDAGEAQLDDNGKTFPYIIMELVRGESLYERKPENLREVLAITRQVCAALDHAHSQGLVHLDLKPENILITPEGHVKLTDFGLARQIATRDSSEGAIVGTVFYLAPEAALRRQTVDGRADLYSLGVILYEISAGCLPFNADDPVAVISQHLYSPVTPPRACKPDIPSPLNELILQLLKKDPNDRPASAAEVLHFIDILEQLDRIEAYNVPAELGLPSLVRLMHGKLVGREHETSELNRLWSNAVDHRGQVALVSGESGIGKTRLLRELMTQVALSGGIALMGTCYAEGNIPYAPFSQMVREAFHTAQTRLDLPDFVLADLIRLAPDLRSQFPDIPPNPSRDPQFEQQYLFDSVTAWCAALTDRAPVLMILDDAQWADSTTLYMLRNLARRGRDLRLMLAVAYREAELDEASPLQNVLVDLGREHLATRLKLTRFDRLQSREMLLSLLHPGGLVDEALVDMVFRETEGNPYFIEEVTKSLVEEEKLQLVEGHWKASSLGDVEIPQSIRIAIQARIARLSAGTQDVLRLAAIIGRKFEFDILMKASEMDEDDLILALENAERAQIIGELPRSRSPSTSFTFAHTLIPSTLRESLSGPRRQRLHQRVASAIETIYRDDGYDVGTLAFHYQEAGDADRARLAYTRAADRAMDLYANLEAERYYRSALELGRLSSERVNILSNLGEALYRQSLYDKAGEVWAEAIELYKLEGDHNHMARLYARSSRAAWFGNDIPRGLQICLDGLEAIRKMPVVPEKLETPGMAALLHETARAYSFNNQPEKAESLSQEALDVAQRLGLVDVQAETLATIGILNNISPEEREKALHQSVELAENNGLLATASRAHFNLGGQLTEFGRFDEARLHLERAIQLSHDMGNLSMEYVSNVALAETYLQQGDYSTVERYLPKMQEMLTLIPNPGDNDIYLHYFTASIQFQRGDLDEAIQAMVSCRDEVRRRNLYKYLGEGDLRLAEMLIYAGRIEEAQAALAEANQYSQFLETSTKATILCLMAVVHLRQGDHDGTRHLIEEAHTLLSPRTFPQQNAYILWISAALAATEKRWQEALEDFSAADKLIASVGARWYQGRLLQDWADVYLMRNESGDQERARELLKKSLALYQNMDLPNFIQLTQDRLAEAGR
jgi:serine/threonine protein kinase/tetratricopeptide (TPR) repeat protein